MQRAQARHPSAQLTTGTARTPDCLSMAQDTMGGFDEEVLLPGEETITTQA